jgi:hypothetical protein
MSSAGTTHNMTRQLPLSFSAIPRRQNESSSDVPTTTTPRINIPPPTRPSSSSTTTRGSSSSSSAQNSSSPASSQISPAVVYINYIKNEVLNKAINYKNMGGRKNAPSELQGQFPWTSMTHVPPHPIIENGRKSPMSSALYLQVNDFYRKTTHFWVPELIFPNLFHHPTFGTKVPCPTCRKEGKEGGGFKDIKCHGWGDPIRVYGEHDIEYLVSKR